MSDICPLCKCKRLGTFIMYEVIDLRTEQCYKLEDVFNKKL